MNNIRQIDSSELLRLLEEGVSAARLTTCRRNTRSLPEGLAYYAWNTALCEALYPSLHAFEIALRNNLHRTLTNKAGSPQWYSSVAGILQQPERNAILDAEDALTSQNKPITPPSIVAELNFGFWAALFDRRYERILWPQSARSVFPHAPVVEMPRERLSSRINRIRRLRNRVFHFEPLWHWGNLPEQHEYVLESTGHINPACRDFARLFDRFDVVHDAGVQPYMDVINGYMTSLPK